MVIKNKKALSIGIVLALTFWVILALIFSPIFGQGKNGLQFADDMFNKLAKGSSYFIPDVLAKTEKFAGRDFSVKIKFEKPELTSSAAKIVSASGTSARVAEDGFTLTGDLGKLLTHILRDADDMFKNNGALVSSRYGMNEKEVMVLWWNILKSMDKELKKVGRIDQAKIVSDVMKKAVEPAYNFYTIEGQRVTEKAGIMSGLLVFYVVYTMWWGFAIFFLFEGMGLTMKKARVRKEV